MPTLRASLPLLLITVLSCGCILPVPTPENTVLGGTPVSEEQLAFIRLGETPKEKVLERLGAPQIIWDDARIFVYEWEMRQGILFWAVAAGYSAGFGAIDIRARYVLAIQFDEEERVHRFERLQRKGLQSFGEFLREWERQTRTSIPEEGDRSR